MSKHHYVYRITNIQENKHYYGVRSSKVEPELDLGIKYFSSSSDKEFIKEQKENKSIFKYKIIKQFNTREEAVNLEVKLHSKFDVGINKSFYNKAKQTSIGFDRSGFPMIYKVTKENHWKNYKTEEEIKMIYDKVSSKNKITRYEQIEKYGHWTENKSADELKLIYDNAIAKQMKTKSSIEYKEKQKTNEKRIESIRLRAENQKGGDNPNAKSFIIYDTNDNVFAQGKGNYREVCKSIGIAPTAFIKYKNNPDGMYSDVLGKQAKTLIKKNGSDKFIGFKIIWW